MQRTRYRVDPQRSVVVDVDTNHVLCAVQDAQQYFDQFGSSTGQQRAIVVQQMQELREQLTTLQQTCTHVYTTYQPRADTGNWCAADDQYWTDLHCYECGLHWRQDQ